MPLGKRETVIAYNHFIEAICVKSVPRKIQQVEIMKQAMKRLSFLKTAYIVKTGIKGDIAPSKRLQTTSYMEIMFQNRYLKTFLG